VENNARRVSNSGGSHHHQNTTFVEMPRLKHPITLPTNAALSSSYLLPSLHPTVVKVFGRLSRPALIDLAESWLTDQNIARCAPYLASEDDDNDEGFGSYGVCESVEEMREVWEELKTTKGSRKDIVDRIVEGDWRGGICLGMLAEADIKCGC
jgi:central kinetochore subunit Mis15/CHL4